MKLFNTVPMDSIWKYENWYSRKDYKRELQLKWIQIMKNIDTG